MSSEQKNRKATTIVPRYWLALGVLLGLSGAGFITIHVQSDTPDLPSAKTIASDSAKARSQTKNTAIVKKPAAPQALPRTKTAFRIHNTALRSRPLPDPVDVRFSGNLWEKGERPRLEAELYLPPVAATPMSAVVIVPSSGGVRYEREIYYAKKLARAGVAVLVVDSYGSRGLRHSVRDQSLLGSWEMSNDAVAGLRWLASDKRFDAQHIAIMGVSKGATAALHTALHVRRRWMRMYDVQFAAHIAISPACTWINRSHANTGAPILFLLAELDNQTPAKPCVEYAARLRKTGNQSIDVKVYKNTHHAWERIGSYPIYSRRAENYAKCRVWVENDGSMTSADTGAPIPEEGWHEWAINNCMTYGVWCCGGSWTQKERGASDVIAFLRKHKFMRAELE